ncbi:MAG: dinitrogenase iron-molybdenum cofactor biosynthesis protein [Candidatus Omnitrophica bacterium]|nr:dinitrogenase iron-molybdenum cofactor biosynthesis protein [Candidatus Omnitrophota bacterium]
MEFIFAFATDDGKTLRGEGHFGNASSYSIYKISSDGYEFIEKRDNFEVEEDEDDKHGDPDKAKAVSSLLKGVDVFVGKRFGPNIKRMIKKFVCIVIREKSVRIEEAVKLIKDNMDRVEEEYKKGEARKPLVFSS